MTDIEKAGETRITVALTSANNEYLAQLADANEETKTGIVNDLFRMARGLGSLGINNTLPTFDPSTGERIVYVLPIDLVDPASQQNPAHEGAGGQPS